MDGSFFQKMNGHACILTGPDRASLFETAREIVQTMQGDDPVHPDVRYLTHEGSGVISVGEVRSQLVNDIFIRPYREPYKIYIVPDSELLGREAQNAILKTLEEPPDYAVILLLTLQPELLLPTVRSRAILLPVEPFAESDEEEYESGILDCIIGLPGASSADIDKTVKLLSEKAKTGFTYGRIFTIVRQWYRDLAYYLQNHTKNLYYTDKIEYYCRWSTHITSAGVYHAFDLIAEAEAELSAGANAELTLKKLFVLLRDGL